MFNLLSGLLETGLIIYVVWTAISISLYLSDNEKGVEGADKKLITNLLVPVKLFDFMKNKVNQLLEKYGLK